MAERGAIATSHEPVTIDAGSALPSPPAPRKRRHHVRLNSIQDVKEELSRLYRAARTGDIETADASRLGFLLVSLSKIMEKSDLEARIERLEQSTAGKQP